MIRRNEINRMHVRRALKSSHLIRFTHPGHLSGTTNRNARDSEKIGYAHAPVRTFSSVTRFNVAAAATRFPRRYHRHFLPADFGINRAT